ncbi:hypothetical protein GMST_40550 [Geomonas silvestris]|uniref:N-acetyltransferase domain-containing protein n=1 Tax=Geomonas silvestris TaxID=2740184 RepID=A0A6V8MNY7_9BACT|nr:GNAT family N-acetyltransferase [Geomonas silvestris]GFO61730.1 hypothetical protein GMST_40550 [Geomonas silvestris]
MLSILLIRFHQFLEEARHNTLAKAVKKLVGKCLHNDSIVVPVYNDLSEVKKIKQEETNNFEFIVVDQRNLGLAERMMKTRSRRMKLAANNRAGYYAYAVACNGEIIGDIWCATHKQTQRNPIHPDLPWLGITCEDEREAYMFDMYVTPDSRGKVTTTYLLANALDHLKKSGYRRVYGFYEKDNLPALWTHRLFGYAELGKRRSYRLLFYKKTEPVAG